MSPTRQDDWVVLLDLREACLQVLIHPDSQQVLCFTWEHCHLQFQVLCFRLYSTAPHVSTHLLAHVFVEFHCRGFRTLQYLDDWIVLQSSAEEAPRAKTYFSELFTDLGSKIY